MHLSLYLILASGLTTIYQNADLNDDQKKATETANRNDQNPAGIAPRIPHFRSVLKTPSNQAGPPSTSPPQSSSSFAPTTAPPVTSSSNSASPQNTFIPPATKNFTSGSASFKTQNSNPVKKSFGDSPNFSSVDPTTKTSLRGSNETASGSVPITNASTASPQRSAVVTQSSNPSTHNNPPKSMTGIPPASQMQQSGFSNRVENFSGSPTFTSGDRGKASDTGASLRSNKITAQDPSSSAPPSTNSGSIYLGSNGSEASSDAANSTPTIEPRGAAQNSPRGALGNSNPEFSSQPSSAQPIPKQPVDMTYDPQLKKIAESILKSNPRGEKNRVSLADVVRIARTSSQRKQLIREYWTGFVNQTDADFADQERRTLQQLAKPNSRMDQALIRAAMSSSEARLAEANLAMAKSNSKIYRYVPTLTKGQELVYADLPWVGKYKTNVDILVSTGRFDPKIQNVDKALIGIRDLIQLRAAAVYDNMKAMQEAVTEYQNGRVALSVVLMLHKEVRDQRIAFLTSVRDYNIAIADFAVTAYPSAVDPKLVAGMLVDTKKTLPKVEVLLDRQIRQASGVQNSSNGNGVGNSTGSQVRQAGGY